MKNEFICNAPLLILDPSQTGPTEVQDVFGVTPAKYAGMSADERLSLAKAANRILSAPLVQLFDAIDVDWVVVGSIPPQVLVAGYRDNEILNDELDEVARQIGAIPFFYSKDEDELPL